MRTPLFIGLVLTVGLCACNQDDLYLKSDSDNMGKHPNEATSYKLTRDMAINRANSLINEIEGNNKTRSSREIAEVVLIGNDNNTRSGLDQDSLLYLINYDDNKGFALLSADLRTNPVYAISDQGNLDLYGENKDFTENIIEGAKNDIITTLETMSSNPINWDITYDGPWIGFKGWEMETVNFAITPKLCDFQSRISPTPELSKFCKTKKGLPAATGCMAIATEQLLSYYSYPSSIDNFPIKWDKINAGNDNTSLAAVLYMLGSGRYLKLHYKQNGPAAGYSKDIPEVLSKLGYNHNGEFIGFDENEETAIEALKTGIILMQGGTTKEDADGHVWIIDGMRQYKYTTEYVAYPREPEYKYANLYHCVWGFKDGSSNGYYYPKVYGFIGKPCVKGNTDSEDDSCSKYAIYDIDITFMYGFQPNL